MTTDRFLVDTNVFILLFNNRLAESLPPGELACSIITEMELMSFPSMTPEEEESIREMLAGLKVYGIDEEIKEEAIRLRRASRLGLPDAIIVATAICHHAILLTNDAELRKVPGSRSRSMAVNR